jgi:gamma-glutamyltranspeptidase / glutathione hydrolase
VSAAAGTSPLSVLRCMALALLAACGTREAANADAIPAAWRAGRATREAVAESAMVVSAAPLATRAGVEVLRSGGNAADAAVAVAFVLEVVYPTAGNIGGGGFIVARMGGQSAALDFREVAPLAATRDMYLDAAGNVTTRSLVGALAAGVPGSVAGLWEMHHRYGSKPWRELLQPAIDLAEHGFAADSAFIEDLHSDSASLARFPASAALFAPGGKLVPLGASWRDPELAATLRRIAGQGRDGFYSGETAKLIVAEMQRSGGIISLEDLRRYRALWRTPVEFSYRGHRVVSMPPASSGGLTVALIANILSGDDLRAMGWHSPEEIHTIAEAERLAFFRRNTMLGDPAFVTIPLASFLSPDTAAALRATIGRSASPDPGSDRGGDKGKHTTHFSIVDAHGNALSMTTTLNEGHGSDLTVTGAGFLLNDEMDDFTTKVGAVNAMGLRQGEANAIEPGKRMLSSMMPTIVLDSTGAPLLVTGASGGAFIITGIAQIMSNVLDFRMTLGQAMAAPRFHAQDYPDAILFENGGISDATLQALTAMGHHPKVLRPGQDLAWAQSILRVDGRWHGVSEPRGNGLALGFPADSAK